MGKLASGATSIKGGRLQKAARMAEGARVGAQCPPGGGEDTRKPKLGPEESVAAFGDVGSSEYRRGKREGERPGVRPIRQNRARLTQRTGVPSHLWERYGSHFAIRFCIAPQPAHRCPENAHWSPEAPGSERLEGKGKQKANRGSALTREHVSGKPWAKAKRQQIAHQQYAGSASTESSLTRL